MQKILSLCLLGLLMTCFNYSHAATAIDSSIYDGVVSDEDPSACSCDSGSDGLAPLITTTETSSCEVDPGSHDYTYYVASQADPDPVGCVKRESDRFSCKKTKCNYSSGPLRCQPNKSGYADCSGWDCYILAKCFGKKVPEGGCNSDSLCATQPHYSLNSPECKTPGAVFCKSGHVGIGVGDGTISQQTCHNGVHRGPIWDSPTWPHFRYCVLIK